MEARGAEEIMERLRRLEGQVHGIQRMVREGRYCIDILTQLAAVRGALQEVELILLERHLQTCVTEAMKSGSPEERQRKIDEILSALGRVQR
ncbi:MAG: metal-sensitive transcriptional regulator [Candidatus Rokubacteria bacterium]|jgi:DNA-binding FrmR family transcriptional regulator|nr:metal-sensitive transcriptional regulator [Candidatus Rokubacteria bacterium]